MPTTTPPATVAPPTSTHSTRQPTTWQWSALLLLLSLGVIWGSGYSLAHFATTHHVPALGYAFWQALGPAVFMSLFMLIARQKFDRSRSSLMLYASTGLIGIALPNSAMYFASAHLPAGILAVVVNTVPLFTFLLALASKENHFRWQRLAAVIICLLGLALLVMPGANWQSPQQGPWLLIALIAPLSFAACAVLIARWQSASCSAASLACGMLIAASLWLMPIVFILHRFYALQLPWNSAWQLRDAVIMLEIVLSSIGYIILCRLLRVAGSVYYSLVGGVVAIVGLIWGRVLFKEHLNIWQYLAVLCIVSSIIILSLCKRYRNQKKTPC